MPFYFDYTILLILPALIISIWAQIKVSYTYKKYSTVFINRSITAADVARGILDRNGLQHIRIEHVRGHLTDHYDPRTGVIRLSDSVFNSSSVAAIGVAAHEAGHAVQYAKNYFPIKIRAAIIPVTRYGSMLAIPLFFIGFLLAQPAFMNLGIILYSAVALFQLVTLPVEFNASARALGELRSNYLKDSEVRGARAVLSAAAMTYVAALLTSLMTLLRLLILAGGRGNRR